MLRDIIALGVCFLGTALASSIEAALGGLPELRVRLAVERRVKGARLLTFWLDAPDRILGTLLVVRSIMVVGAGVFGYRIALQLGLDAPAAAIALGVGVVLALVAGFAPQSVGKRFALGWSIQTLRLVRALTVVLTPIVWPLRWATRRMAQTLFPALGRRGSPAFWPPDEVVGLAQDVRADALGRSSEDLLHSIIEFSDTVIREVMVPRTEMVALPAASPLADVERMVVDKGHSRVPVYEETIDNILGLLYVKDLFGSSSAPRAQDMAEFDLRKLLRPTFYVPEVMKISELLREFQRRKTHLAIVVDEYGGTAGLVTLEDIIEEITGEIQDELDVEDKQFRVLGDGKILADGRVSIWDLEKPLGVKLPEDGSYETLAGFVMARAGCLPRPGTVVTWDNLRFTVKEANERRIRMVEIERRKAEPTAAVR